MASFNGTPMVAMKTSGMCLAADRTPRVIEAIENQFGGIDERSIQIEENCFATRHGFGTSVEKRVLVVVHAFGRDSLRVPVTGTLAELPTTLLFSSRRTRNDGQDSLKRAVLRGWG